MDKKLRASSIGILNKETGERIKMLIEQSGYTVDDIRIVIGLKNPQAIYKWQRGETIPSTDNLLILSKEVFHNSIDDILVYDGGEDLDTGGDDEKN